MYNADLFALFVQIFHSFTGSFDTGTHQHDDTRSVGIAIILIQIISASSQLRKFFHGLFRDSRAGIVVAVDRLSCLEIDIRILRCTANNGSIRAHTAISVGNDQIIVHHLLYNAVRDYLNF